MASFCFLSIRAAAYASLERAQSEVIRAIVSGYSPCCGPPHRRPTGRLSLGWIPAQRIKTVGLKRWHAGRLDRFWIISLVLQRCKTVGQRRYLF